MTEAQRAQAAEPPEQDPADEGPDLSVRTEEVGDRTWTLQDLPDGRSWEVFRGAVDAGRPGERIATVVVDDTGYFSTDRHGTVRGPYVTLDEAVYPVGLDDPTLLGLDVVGQERDVASEPSPTGPAPTSSSEPRQATRAAPATPAAPPIGRPGLLLPAVAVLVGLVAVLSFRRGRSAARTRRPGRRSGR